MKKEAMIDLFNTNVKDIDVIIKSVSKVRKKYEVEVEYITTTSNEIDYDINKYIFLEDTIISFHIFENKTFQTNEFEEILVKDEYFKLLNNAFNLLSYKLRSEYELTSKLKEKTTKTQLIDDVISKLKTLGYINDYNYATIVSKSLQAKLKGPNQIKETLKKNRIDEEIIKDVLLEYDYDIASGNIDKIISKNLDKLYKYPVGKQKQRLTSLLVSCGYSLDVISDRLNRVSFSCDIKSTLDKDLSKLKKKYSDKKYEKYSKYEINRKIMQSLLNKGYSYNDIKNVGI